MGQHQVSRTTRFADKSGSVTEPLTPFMPRKNWHLDVEHPGVDDFYTASRRAKTDITAVIARRSAPVVTPERLQLAAARSRPLRRKAAVDWSKLRAYSDEKLGLVGRVLVTDAPPTLPARERIQDLTSEDVEARHARQDSRRMKYRLQRMAAKLRPSERVACCHRMVKDSAAGVRILRSKDGRAYFDGVQTCGSVWLCPVCAAKITERRRNELQELIDAHRVAGGSLLFLTLTIPHQRHDVLTAPAMRKVKKVQEIEICKDTGEVVREVAYRLVDPTTGEVLEKISSRKAAKLSPTGEIVTVESEHIERVNGGRLIPDADGGLVFEASGIVPRLTSAYRRFMSGRGALSQLLNGDQGAEYVGSVRALEVTHGRNNGYHPHLHVLLLVDRELSDDELSDLDRQLLCKWARAVEAEGMGEISRHGLRLERPKVAGDIDELTQYVIKWGAAEELSKLHTKKAGMNLHGNGKKGLSPWELLAAAADGDLYAAGIWKEYAAAFKGRRQLVYSHGLRKRYGLAKEKTDEELSDAPEPEQHEEVHTVTKPQWIALRACGDRATVLDLAEYGTRQVLGYLAECVTQFEAEYGPLGVVRAESSILEAASWSDSG